MMDIAKISDKNEIMELYKAVIDKVSKTAIRLGWRIDVYPNEQFVDEAILLGQMCVLREDGKITAAAVVNHTVNPEYDDIDWEIKQPKEKIATIHALAVLPERQGSGTAATMLADIEDHCRKKGDISIHLDALDTNIPAYKLYTRNGYKEVDRIEMYYEVVGTRGFWMLEHVL